MFDIGWTEMALIAVVAVVVIGPKELPKVMRELGTWVARARGMSRVFMDQLEEMSRQSGIDEVRKEAEKLRQLNPAREIEKAVDPEGVIARQTADIGQVGTPLDPALPPPATPTPSGETIAPPMPAPTEQPVTQTADPAPPSPTEPSPAAATPPATNPRGPGDGAP